jgi:hypothetical protein
MRRATALVPLLGLTALGMTSLGPPARAELPLDPADYPDCGEPDCDSCCPSDLDGRWDFISYVPPQSRAGIRPAEEALGSGIWVDRAWRTTLGRTDVVIAVGDSGINWASGRMVRKWYLHAGELPLPQGADGTPAAAHDRNGDGVFNIDDYAEDPRLDPAAGEDVADGLLDPSDLIATFSDGVDDDGDGYADNISGWDFFGRDNNAYHTYADGYGTHGDGVARDMGAEGGDEDSGDIGVCPNCMVLPVRLGDTFITDGQRVAEGIVFAADSGAVAMSLAIGALTNSDSTAAAARYAFDQGLTLVGAAGDENTYHHNFPAVMDDILYVHSIRHNTASEDGAAYSYSNTWNCNNYGSRLVVVAPSSACATGAVANITGMIGLMHSAARDAGVQLRAGEVYQLVVGTADDIWLSDAEREQSKAYPSAEGWDAFFGYGRVNAARAVEAIAAAELPPIVSIRSPAWFDLIDPRDTPSLPLEVLISAERSSGFTWVLEQGLGDDPRSWTELDTGSGSGTFEGVLTEVDLTSIPWTPPPVADPSEGVMERVDRVNANEVTLRLRVTDADGRQGELRKSFFVDLDPDRLPGWPVSLGASAESSPVLADLNGDGVFEVIAAGTDGRVWALDGDGAPLPGWPVRTGELEHHTGSAAFTSGAVPPLHDAVLAGSSVGDLDADGQPEVVVSTLGGAIYAWHADGSPVAGFPVEMLGREPEELDTLHTWDRGFVGAAALADLDGDGRLEIINTGMDQRLYVWTSEGAPFGPYPTEPCHPMLCGQEGRRMITSPTVGDVDGDGDLDIGFGSNESPNDGRMVVTHLVDGRTGEPLPGWPRADLGLVNEAVLLPLLGEGHPASLAFADIDGDGDLEIANPILFGTAGLLHHDGNPALDLPHFAESYPEGTDVDPSLAPALVQFVTNPAFGDMTGDGVPDYVLGGASTLALVALALIEWMDFQQMVGGWDGATGALMPGWPRQIEDFQFLMAPAIADVSGDGMAEAVYASAGYLVHAWDAQGQETVGFPKQTGQWILGSPTVGDINGDGYLDVVVSTREGYVFAWSTAGRADQAVQWAGQFHDAQNTGNYENPLPTQAGPSAVGGGAGEGGCCGGKGSEAAWLALPLGLLGLRRRRRA